MNKVLLIVTLMISFSISAQEISDSLDFRKPENYDDAAAFYVKQIEINNTDAANYYLAACYFSLLNDNNNAIIYLKEAITKGAHPEDILTDTDFNGLKQDSITWKQIHILLKVQYAIQNPGITNLDLGYELWLMWVEDQRYRTFKKNYKLTEKPQDDLALHDRHLQRVKVIINESGWPQYSEVGKAGGDAVFFIFQHDNAENMETVLPMFIAVAKAGEADITKAAMMIDRYLAYTEKVQIYGTQAYRKIEPGQQRNDIPLQLYPIVDEENLINRRNAIGMGDFIENCTRLGVTYIPITSRTDYAPIEFKKKWIKAGYLL